MALKDTKRKMKNEGPSALGLQGRERKKKEIKEEKEGDFEQHTRLRAAASSMLSPSQLHCRE